MKMLLIVSLFAAPLFLGMGSYSPQESLPVPPPPIEEPAEVLVKAEIKGEKKEIDKLSPIVAAVEKIINSPEFSKRVLSSTFEDTNDSSSEILKRIKSKSWALTYEFKMQKNWRGRCPVLGWTYPSTQIVWFNSCTFMGREDAGIAGTICHEQMHKLRYDHRSASSLQSVPYSVGTICSELFAR